MDEGEDPCIGLCIIGEDGRCQGCGRTEEEIYGPPPGGADDDAADRDLTAPATAAG